MTRTRTKRTVSFDEYSGIMNANRFLMQENVNLKMENALLKAKIKRMENYEKNNNEHGVAQSRRDKSC